MAGGSPEADAPPASSPSVVASRSLFGAATLFFGIIPAPLFDLAVDAGRSLTQLF